jgi:hypothetical protein
MIVNLLVALIIAFSITPGGHQQRGFAPRYAPGVMERVARHRHMPIADCMISSPVLPLGTKVTVYGENTHRALECVVVDVSHPRDKARHIRTKRVIELGYASAEAICGKKHMRDPPIKCPVTIFWNDEKLP